MTVLNTADKIYVGSNLASAIYAGTKLVWPPPLPALIPGLGAWFDASQDVGRFNDGQKISTYVEHSPNRREFVATPGLEPTFRTNSVRGMPRLQFANSGMTHPSWNSGPDGLTFVMLTQTDAPSNYGMMLVTGPDADGFEMRYSAGSFAVQLVSRYETHSLYWQTSFSMQPNVDFVNMFRVNRVAGIGEHWFNNANRSSGLSPLQMLPGNQTLYIGRRQGGYYLNGLVAEAMVYAGAISDTDRDLLWNYLRDKWGMP